MESEFYRDNLEQVLKFTNGKHLLNKKEVCAFTGILDIRTVNKHFPFSESGYISAATLARCMSKTK